MILGIGTDLANIERIQGTLDRFGDRFRNRVFTEVEQRKAERRKDVAGTYAKRWAAKEAAAKALGTGIAAGISFQHIEINSLDSGQPILLLTEKALLVAQEKGATTWHVSLSDETLYATAFVVLSC